MAEEQNLSSPNDEESFEEVGNEEYANDENDDDGPGLSLNLGGDDDDDNEENNVDDQEMRNSAGLNSPKGETRLELEDETEVSDNPSPATAMRNKYGVNSPKGDTNRISWDSNEEKKKNGGGGPQSLITQVQRPDPNSNPITSVQRNDDGDEHIQKTLEDNTKSQGFWSCFSSLCSCCSSPQVTVGDDDEEHQIQDKQEIQLPSNSKDKQPNEKLLQKTTKDNNNTVQQDDKRESISESDTIYDGDLLPDLSEENKGKKCLVLDLDETLVHSSFKPIPKPDFIIPVEIDHVVHHVYVLKRPYVDEFLERCAKVYEIVIFTASLSKYADPLLDKLDPKGFIAHRLFRESCVIHGTAYVKDLRKLNRKLKNSIIVDNSPPSYLFQPTCAVPIASWFDDPNDTQLKDFLPVLETTLKDIPDVRKILDAHNKSFRWLCNQANKPLSNYGY